MFREGARDALHGLPLYGAHFGSTLAVALPFLYPPAAALFLTPLQTVSPTVMKWVWELLCVGEVLLVVAYSFRGLRDRSGPAWPIVVSVVSAIMLWTTPVHDLLGFGQIDLLLMSLVIVDLVAQPRWCPRGVLVGIAAAVKLVPGIFLLFFLINKDWRSARNFVAGFGGATLLTFAILPSDSNAYWFHYLLHTARASFLLYFSNQSLDGMLRRVIGGNTYLAVWVPAAALTLGMGMWKARRAERSGNRLTAVALVGVVGLILSPISWVHELVWIIPMIGVIVGNGRNRRRLALAAVLTVGFIVHVPYMGNDLLIGHGSRFLGNLLEDVYGLVLVALVVTGSWWWDLDAPGDTSLAIRQESGELSREPATSRA